MKRVKEAIVLVLLMTLVFICPLWSGITGKIAGTVTDKETGEPLYGANVVVVGTTLGAATDQDGHYTILYIPPGVYDIQVFVIGYSKVTVSEVRVEIDQTARVDIALEIEAIKGEAVTVTAERKVVKADVATSVAALTGSEVENLPLSNVNEVVGLQAGVEDGFVIRGGGADEALFQVDGITLRDPRNNKPITGMALSAIKEISVERGGFNAEYGQVRSGLVNVITKEGSKSGYHGTITLKYSPPAPKHFGVSPYDKNSMWKLPYLDDEVCWTGTEYFEPFTDLNSNRRWDDGEPFEDLNSDGKHQGWDSYISRQYRKFRGWNTVSYELLTDNDPSNDLSPIAAQKLFLWEFRQRPVTNQPDYNIDAGFGGAVPFIGKGLGNLRFFTSYRREREMLLVPLARDDYLDYDWSLQLVSDITKSMKLRITGLTGKSYNIAINDDDERYYGTEFGPSGVIGWSPTQYIRTPIQIAKATDEQRCGRIFSDSWYCPAEVSYYSFAAKLTHALSSKTFYEASVDHIARKYETGPIAERDTTRRYEIVPGYFVDEAPFGFSPISSGGIGGANPLFGGHTSEARDSSLISSTTLKFDLTSQVNFSNMVKTGFEFIYSDLDMNYGMVNLAVGPVIKEIWHEFPIRSAFYIQDKLEAMGFIMNIGLRMDYSDANTEWVKTDPFDKEFFSSNYDPSKPYNYEKTKADISFSPRLGISHPITENSKLFFNYGHFKQLPTYEELLRIGRSAGGAMQNYGDPNLNLAKTVTYELGYDHALFNTLLIQAAAFYHDITDQQTFTTYNRADGSVTYNAANSNSYEDIRGFELTLRKSTGRWWSGFANYTYQVNTSGFFGKRSIFQSVSEQRRYDEDTRKLYQDKPLPKPYARVNLILHSPQDFGSSIFGLKPLGGWMMSFIYNWKAGEFITWNPGMIPDVYDNVQVRDYHVTQLSLNKSFQMKKMRITFFTEIDNLFNTKHLSGASFYDTDDWLYYMHSLHLPERKEDYDNIIGNDRAGDYRKKGVAFQPIEQVKVGLVDDLGSPNASVVYYETSSKRYMNCIDGKWEEVESSRMKNILNDKAYIDMPNQTSFNFLNPRQWFFGIRMSFGLD